MENNYERNRQKIIDEQMDNFGYHFCQHCQKSRGVFKFEVHHIIFRSEAPKHDHLHNVRNLIILCNSCHNGGGDSFHNRKNKRDYLIKDRKLYELFTWLNPTLKEIAEH